MNLTQSTTIVAASDQVSSELAGESVILNVKTGLYFGLNQVGASIWDKIQSPKTVEELCNAITDEYDVAPDLCMTDVQDLLREMMAADLIEVR